MSTGFYNYKYKCQSRCYQHPPALSLTRSNSMSNNTRLRARYRRIYEKYYGSIPKDSDGRSYDIHHIDGDHTNNDISNLKAVTIQEHYDIHYAQKDWPACFAIANRIKIDPAEKSKLLKKWHQTRLQNGNHHLVGDRNPSHKRVKDGTHNFIGGENIKRIQQNLVKCGKHNFLDSDYHKINAKKLLEAGTHHSQLQYTCPHCGKIGQGNSMKRWHMDNCKHRKVDD